jgi:hypothetical protein
MSRVGRRSPVNRAPSRASKRSAGSRRPPR